MKYGCIIGEEKIWAATPGGTGEEFKGMVMHAIEQNTIPLLTDWLV
jgi:hypothetical protein